MRKPSDRHLGSRLRCQRLEQLFRTPAERNNARMAQAECLLELSDRRLEQNHRRGCRAAAVVSRRNQLHKVTDAMRVARSGLSVCD